MREFVGLMCAFFCVFAAVDANAERCEFKKMMRFNKTEVSRHHTGQAYFFVSDHMAVDADGAPDAYHPDDFGLDYLANAGYPAKQWWRDVLVVDPHDSDRAYTQKMGEYAGYFVSKTSLQDRSKAVTDPTRYVDSRNIPYLVFPGDFYRSKGTGLLGDLGMAIHLPTQAKVAFVVADIGPGRASLGEVSISLAEGLGGDNVNPKNGDGVPPGEVLYIVFPYSSRVYGWPMGPEAISAAANKLYNAMGGDNAILACRVSK